MGSNWAKVSIESIKANEKGSIAIGPFGSRLKSDNYVSDGIPVIRGTNVTAGPTFKGDFVYITEDKADSLGACNVYKNELVFPHRGSIGEVGFVQEDKRYVLSSSLMKLKVDEEQVNPMFLYYFFKSSTGKHELLKNASQVGTPGIGQPLSSLKSILFNKPPLVIQNKIVDVLSSVNNKLELNNQINQTLEQMAQTLFKSWFVDFAPVKAKMNGEQAKGMDAATASLFPEKLVESELGLIPEGWEVKPFKKVIDKYVDNRGKTPPIVEEGIPLVEVKHLPESSTFPNLSTDKRVTEETFNTWFRVHVEPKDVLISTVGTIGRTSFVKNTNFGIAQNVLGLRFGKIVEPEYMFYTIKAHRFQHDMDARLVTTVQSSIKRKDLDTIDILVPPSNVQKEFCKLVGGLLDGQYSKNAENINLASLRDTLLPKLLSGEIDLENVQVEQAKTIAE
ncbi:MULTISPECIES: restriction endonuclease subunit S [Vibrio]|uniref:restriction endonuclease subunit S n=1 Tax=Vibrio TaxID=662 RepID=UPI00030F3654|nr:restriction endonuclease subunit S [Vibrio splendidus]MDP2589614.1 restriction endonuclease subunit S [Vibrio splendidus]OEE55283.1 hypothetical protein A146_19790 [Vibrio splendidus FF-500]